MKSIYLIAQILFINIGFICAQIVDNSFHEPVPYRPAKINVIKVLPDGKILLGGDIDFFKEKIVNNLIRLNTDGTLDEGFNFNGNGNLLIERIVLQNSGDMVVLAQPYKSQTETYSYVSSLFWLDATGNIKKEINSLPYISSIAIQDDDKVLVCGIKNPNGFLNRYNADLTLDDSFDNAMIFNNQVNDVAFKNGKIVAVGLFSVVKDTDVNNIVKLDLNGAIDTTFNTGTGTTDYIGSLTIQEDDRIILGNTYISSFNGFPCGGMVRLNPDGSVDASLQSPSMNGIYSRFVVKDTSIYFSAFKDVNGIYGSYMFRLKSNGEMDPAFKAILIDEYGFQDFHLDFLQENIIYNNSSSTGNIYGVSMSDPAGNLIGSFNPEISRYGTVKLGDYFNGKLVVSGDFIKVDGMETYGIAMINDDGRLDQSFSLSKNLGKPIQIKVLNDTSLLFSTGKSLVKLNTKAQIMQDFNFHPFKTLYEVLKFKVLSNDKIFAGNSNNVYRLNADGTEDTDFDIGTGIGGIQCTAYDFDIQDDKVIFGSMFDQFNGIPVNKLVRLNSDGSPDQTFDIGTGPDNLVTTIKVLSSGEMIIGGSFKNFNGTEIPHGLVKLTADGYLDNEFNENQKSSALTGVSWFNTKVEQSDTMLYIKGMDVYGLEIVIAVNINKMVNHEFTMPITVNLINDIIVSNDGAQQFKKTKSTSSDENNSYMFALGNFEYGGGVGTSFIMKLALGNESLPTQVDNTDTENVRLYPMPVNDKLYISFSEPDIQADFSVYNLNGQQLYSSHINSPYEEVEMQNFASGVYVVKIATASGKISTYKIIKK